MRKPRLVDVCCCQGGASRGYADAGFDVTGVDIDPQPRYPFTFIQSDAVTWLREHAHEYDAIAASPPCQAHTLAQRIQGNEHPDLIEPVRELLIRSGKPWVIENVVGAPLLDPQMLCGAMFGLETYRHRLFETGGGFAFDAPEHPMHVAKTTKMGRPVQPGEFMHVVGNFTGVDKARDVMEMPWATRDGLREAIPPAYTKYIGERLMAHVMAGEMEVAA
ncbi:SAM-dependent methyltransferase [Streptomyces caniferus]|uniref:SAM-dependent methyltransferase n=1 Tax=Streptomyces caniferus TaxID=285557 RepID=UPI002E2B552F|nr:SAM-dependent methyltransferase [Streptomyces caniferus]